MKSPYVGGAALAVTLLAGYSIFYAQPLVAETISSPQEATQKAKKKEAALQDAVVPAKLATIPDKTRPGITAAILGTPDTIDPTVALIETYTATAYCFTGRTASGRLVSKGLIAADPTVLPLGTRVRLQAGNWSGDYTVADTGGAIRGRKIDIWVPTSHEAFRFGRRKVKLTVLNYGVKRARKRARQ